MISKRCFILAVLLIVGVLPSVSAQTACVSGERFCADDNEQFCVNSRWTKTRHCEYGCAPTGGCVEKTITCQTIRQGKINIVFAGLGYAQEDLETFKHNIINAIDFEKANQGILGFEPFASNANFFGFAYVDDISLTDFEKIKDVCKAQNPQYIILMNKEKFPAFSPSGDFQGHVRFPTLIADPAQCEGLVQYCPATDTNHDGCADASADADFNKDRMIDATDTTIRKICVGSRQGCSDQTSLINYCYPLNGITLAHEFGHAFGNLLDEYVDLPRGETSEARLANINRSQAQNCYFGTLAECREKASWSDLIGKEGTGCYPGCSYRADAYRPTEKGIMNDYIVTRYGLAEERVLCNKIKEQAGMWEGYCTQFAPSFWERMWNWLLAFFH